MATFTIDLLTGKVYLFSGDFSGSGSTPTSGSTYPQVNTYSSLPSAASSSGQTYLVRNGSGDTVLNRKPAGLYYSTGSVWRYLGDTPDAFLSNNFQIVDSDDTSKGVMFETSGITTGTFPTLTIQNGDGTLAYLTDLNTKVDVSVFSGYTGTTLTQITGNTASIQANDADIIYISGITDTKLDIDAQFITGVTASGGTILDVTDKVLTIYSPTGGTSGDYVETTLFNTYTGNTYSNISGITTASGKTVINSGLTIASGEFLLVDAVYDDLSVPVTATEVAGSNPPVTGIFINDDPTGGTGTALSFNGSNQYLEIPHDATLDFGDSYSIEFWVRTRPETVVWSSYFMRKLGSFYINYIGGNYIRWQVSGYANLDASVSLNVNSWNHVACTLTNSGVGNDVLTIYINGNSAGTVGPTFGTPGTSTNNIFIGSGNAGSNTADCDIDEIRFWGYALSPTEVMDSYNSGIGTHGIDTTDLMGGYHLDEGIGSNVYDYGLNNNSGTTTNNPVWITGKIGSPASRGVLTKFFTTGSTQELYFSVQMPHTWKKNSTIFPHVHWSPTNDLIGDVVWGLEYSWSNIGEIFPTTNIIYITQTTSGTGYTHQMTPTFKSDTSTGITKTNGNESSMLICRVFREPSNSGDTYTNSVAFHEIDMHYLIEKLGDSLGLGFHT